MEGRDEPPELRGIIPSAFNYIFETIARQSESGVLPFPALRIVSCR